jgi:hypothetical protein
MNFGLGGLCLSRKADKPFEKHKEYQNAILSKADYYVFQFGTNDARYVVEVLVFLYFFMGGLFWLFIVGLFCYICIFYYLYVDSLTYAFGWSAFFRRIRFVTPLVVIFFK